MTVLYVALTVLYVRWSAPIGKEVNDELDAEEVREGHVNLVQEGGKRKWL